MYNDLLKIGPLTIHGYGLMIGLGIVVCIYLASKRAKSRGLDEEIVFNLGLVGPISGIIGAKLLYVIVELKAFIKSPLELLSSSGFIVYGGLIAGVFGALIYCKIKKVKAIEYIDLAAPSIAIAQAFGRIGCFLAGCCYGCKTDSFIGIVFHKSDFAPNGVKLIPTQLISSALLFALTIILLIYARKKRKNGMVIALYMVLYSVGRFIIEFYRDDFRGTVGNISTSQFIAIFTFIIGISIMIFNWLKTEKD